MTSSQIQECSKIKFSDFSFNKLIISLIKDDLINSKLVPGLNEIGLEAQNYFLHLSETIFELMGFDDSEKSDEIYREYIALSKRAFNIDLSKDNAGMNKLAQEIYQFLEEKSRKIKSI